VLLFPLLSSMPYLQLLLFVVLVLVVVVVVTSITCMQGIYSYIPRITLIDQMT